MVETSIHGRGYTSSRLGGAVPDAGADEGAKDNRQLEQPAPEGLKPAFSSNIWPLARPNIAKMGEGRLKMAGGRFKVGEG